MAGGEFRFGTASIYMAEAESFGRPVQVTNALLHGYKLRRVEAVFPGIPPIYSNGKSEARVKCRWRSDGTVCRAACARHRFRFSIDGIRRMLDTSTDELARLVHTLHETQQRIQALTGGSVDAVVDAASGSAYLLPASQAHLRRSEFEQRCFAAERASILDALPAHIALLDAQGRIVAVN